MSVENFLSAQIRNLNEIFGAATETPDTLNRFMGGRVRNNQPFISGYHQVYFNLPNGIFGGEETNAVKWLMSTCEGFTPHSSNINFVDVNGIGQLGASFPASRTYNREFTLTFREYREFPILNIFRTWNGLFDPHTGITSVEHDQYIPSFYKGSVWVGVLKPTASVGSGRFIELEDLEEVYFYDGVFPTLVPDDTATASDQATNDSVQLSITFKFDGAPLDKSFAGLAAKFQGLVSSIDYNLPYAAIEAAFPTP
jgi:hypothetical protein